MLCVPPLRTLACAISPIGVANGAARRMWLPRTVRGRVLTGTNLTSSRGSTCVGPRLSHTLPGTSFVGCRRVVLTIILETLSLDRRALRVGSRWHLSHTATWRIWEPDEFQPPAIAQTLSIYKLTVLLRSFTTTECCANTRMLSMSLNLTTLSTARTDRYQGILIVLWSYRGLRVGSPWIAA